MTGKRVRTVRKNVKAGVNRIVVRAPKRSGLHILKLRGRSSDGQVQTSTVVLKVRRAH